MPQQQRVVAVLVTWDRKQLLGEALAAVYAQTAPLQRVYVVDNASTDGTSDFVATAYPQARLVRLPRNCGGAGGFAAGLAHALHEGCDLVWLMDDDTVPDRDALAALLEAWHGYPGRRRPALVASRVVWADGREHPMNTPRSKPAATASERVAAARVACLPVRSASFVSVLCDAGALAERGLPIADYFLWNDDFEFTTRLLRGRIGLLCPASRVVHKTATFGATDADPGERFFFEVRNKVWLFTRSGGLAPVERVLYAGSTLRRWARTFRAAGDRRLLGRCLLRGLAAGLRAGPRPTEQVLAELGVPVPAELAGGRP